MRQALLCFDTFNFQPEKDREERRGGPGEMPGAWPDAYSLPAAGIKPKPAGSSLNTFPVSGVLVVSSNRERHQEHV